MALRMTWVLLSVLSIGTVPLRAEERVEPASALAWKPKAYPEATLHPRIAFLQPQRAWERMDVWVPNEPAEGKLPCIIAIYGGGYGDKSGGFINDVRPLLSRGFVIAAPDYALQTDAPVPLCSWDVACAIRHLRANAEKYRIDPERIGVWGWSAGGWIAQDLCYAGPQRVVHSQTKIGNEKVSRWLPMIEPRPVHAEQSIRVQAVVSDWGAQKLWNKRTLAPQPWLSADDPPLFTCYNEAYQDDLVNPVMLLRKLGIPSSGVYGVKGNTHVPDIKTPAMLESGAATTWGDSIYDFFESQVKNIDTATAPELIPHGGPIAGPTAVRMLTVHPTGEIRYTLDGTSPDRSSPRYDKPVTVKPGQTLRAVAFREGLKPSRIATGTFVEGPVKPTIRTAERSFEAEAGKPYRVAFEADHAEGARWYVGGKTGQSYRELDGQRFNPPRHISWLTIDEKTGVLSGTPRGQGVHPVVVSCVNVPSQAKPDEMSLAGDAVLIVITVKPAGR